MIITNDVHKAPAILKWYQLTYLIVISFLLSLPFGFVGTFLDAFRVIVMIFALPIWIFLLLRDRAISYYFDDNKVTIIKGILFKEMNTIPFQNIQIVTIKTGLLLNLFGLSAISIWTASLSQRAGKHNNEPDGYLKLRSEDAAHLQEIILQKSKM